jgi:hypothetical protein
MRPKQWPAGRAPRPSRATSDSAGPAIATLRVAATTTVSIIRCAGIACIAAEVIIWHSYYAVPWRLAGPVLAMAWGMVAVAYISRHWPSVSLAVADSIVYIALALCARWCLPQVLSTGVGIIFAAIRPTLRAQGRAAVRRAALASQSAAKADAVAAIREDRRVRLALLEAEALPLLHAIAAGTLEPADSAVRDRCARLATTFRRSLTDGLRGAGRGLVAALEPVLRAASARGLLVDVQTIGDHGVPGPEVSAAALAVIDGVLVTLPPQPVTLTVLESADDVALYLAFIQPPRSAPDAALAGQRVPPSAQWHAGIDMDDTGAGCLEVSWHKA